MNARHITYRPVRDAIALALFVAVTGFLLVAMSAGRAHAAAVAHSSAATPAQSACAAFGAWERHETGPNLGRLVVASTRLGRSYLKADIGQLYADASSPSAKSAKYVTSDRNYVTEDCAKL